MNPIPPIPHLLRQSPFPLSHAHGHKLSSRLRGRSLRQRPSLPRQTTRKLDRALQDEPSHWIILDRQGMRAEPHRFQRDGSPSREDIEHSGSTSSVGLADQPPKPFQLTLVTRPPPCDFLYPQAEFLPLPRRIGGTCERLILPSKLWRSIFRIRQQRCDHRRAAGRERTSCRPDVQRREMASAPGGLLMFRVRAGLLQRKCLFDEPAHPQSSSPIGRCSSDSNPSTSATLIVTPPLGLPIPCPAGSLTHRSTGEESQ